MPNRSPSSTLPPKVEQKKLVLASRGSPLALWQANYVAGLLRGHGYHIDIQTWKTTGDIVQDRFLHEIGGKGLFIKELEEAMAQQKADFAVHSLKDLPAKIPDGFALSSVLKRHSSSDVMIFRKDLWPKLGLAAETLLNSKIIDSLGPMIVATSSLRRQSLLKKCKHVTSVPVRGNVDTRIKKLDTEGWSAIILAEASLERLNITDVHALRLDPQWFIPCAGQGALAIETKSDSEALAITSKLECPLTRLCVNIEREILEKLGGDCTMPFGCLAQKDNRDPNRILVNAIVLDAEGKFARASKSLPLTMEHLESNLVKSILSELRNNGANELLKNLGIPARI